MRSFLDPPVKQGTTVKGSGRVAYCLQTRNHSSHLVRAGTELYEQVGQARVHMDVPNFRRHISTLSFFMCTSFCGVYFYSCTLPFSVLLSMLVFPVYDFFVMDTSVRTSVLLCFMYHARLLFTCTPPPRRTARRTGRTGANPLYSVCGMGTWF